MVRLNGTFVASNVRMHEITPSFPGSGIMILHIWQATLTRARATISVKYISLLTGPIFDNGLTVQHSAPKDRLASFNSL
jgi:hypothetical protein